MFTIGNWRNQKKKIKKKIKGNLLIALSSIMEI